MRIFSPRSTNRLRAPRPDASDGRSPRRHGRLARRLALVVAVSAAGVAAAVLPSLADTQTVNATAYSTWDRTQVTVTQGDTVTFNNNTTFCHNIVIQDANAHVVGNAPSTQDMACTPKAHPTAKMFSYAFATSNLAPGNYTFMCEIHGSSMSGTLTVNAPGQANPGTGPGMAPPATPPATGPATNPNAPGADSGRGQANVKPRHRRHRHRHHRRHHRRGRHGRHG